MKECVVKSPTVMHFPTITGEVCYLSFGYNTKFNYRELSNGNVALYRNQIDIEIKRNEFERLFKIVKKE